MSPQVARFAAVQQDVGNGRTEVVRVGTDRSAVKIDTRFEPWLLTA
jgi:hypothetical protein